MLTTDLINYCTVLADKYSSPNVVQTEWLSFLNHATNEYMNRLSPDNQNVSVQGGSVNYETDKNVITNIQPLIYQLSGLAMNSNGVLTDSVTNTALQATAGNSSASYWRIMATAATVGGVTYPAKYVRQNNLYEFQRNYYKKPTTTNPKYTMVSGGIQFFPTNTSATLNVTVIKKPYVLAVSPVQNPELPDYCLYEIIAIAVQLSGVSIRDEELITDVRNISLQAK